ncbi:3-oxoacyl-[acyl-carrier-protein] reductase [Penicillium brasilianum]|uniref:3-oxoacyl-[acyl-carrier-protein] reductase n=1 Tax=Penicillium brasilianum TaxID=104259 RepID=A0A1S9RU89_PENBI|nr:3-oxoacyl-[acyl-carrier-protein] reductase [Penicillium brasilianum]
MSYADLKNKVFFVTGAASGQGRATSILLARQGAKLALLDLNDPQEVIEEIEKVGGEAIAFKIDVVNSAGIEAAVKATKEHYGKIDGAANLAGWIGTQGFTGKGYALDVITDEEWDKMMSINLNGIRNSLSAELRHIANGGSIVNVASIAGQRGSPWNAPYGAAKWGVISLTKSAAQEAGPKNVRVNAVAPGVVDTPLATALGSPDLVFQRMVSRSALQRLAQPEEIAQCILFLLSDSSSFVTGSVLNADGGFQ